MLCEVAIVLTVYGIETNTISLVAMWYLTVAIVLTVYGIETSNMLRMQQY